MEKNIILNHQQIKHKIKRIAYQIFETFSEESEIFLAGISKSGYKFAEEITKELNLISDLKVTLIEVQVNKQNPSDAIITNIDSKDYSNKCIVLIDDVLNSGQVLIYAVKHFLNVPIKKFKTAVLIDRNHKRYPIKADFKGLSLSTSLKEHVEVIFDVENSHVTLS